LRLYLKLKTLITLALSTDERGFAINATLIASILRRTERAVWVRCWCRGFLPESFETGRLRVEFLPAVEEVTGRYPGTSGPAAYDRLLVIRDCPDWDRCMVMDYDQLVLCDLAPVFELELGDHLLAAHLQGPGVDMAYAMRVWLKRPMPTGWEHVASHPYFLMPPMLNLKAMRDAGTWENFLRAHAAFGADEQLSLTAATEGRTLPLDRKWNLFPQLHLAPDEVPEGVIHWSGWPKPWHPDAKVWRPDLWLAEQVSWEHLRLGIWDKPVALEVGPEDGRGTRALAGRGWRVKVFLPNGNGSAAGMAAGCDEPEAYPPGDDLLTPGFPDVTVEHSGAAGFQAALAAAGGNIDCVRLGLWEEADEWLAGSRVLPEYLVLKGAMEAAAVDRVRGWGYDRELRLVAGDWPAGGPLPRVLKYGPPAIGRALEAGEWLYLRREGAGVLSAGLRCGPRPEVAVVAGPEKIGVAVVATGNRRKLLGQLLRSVRRNFLRGHEVKIVVFTDGEMALDAGLEVIQVESSPWPGSGLVRFAWLREHAAAFAGFDYLFLLEAEVMVTGPVGREVLGDGLTAVLHAGFHDLARERFSYERREESAACVRAWEGERYFTGAVQGGRTADYLVAVARMAAAVAADERNGVTAVWQAESHWNRCLVDTPPSVVLSPSYGRPEFQATEFPPLVLLRVAHEDEVRK
jgi:hypothetical protein